MADRQSRTCFWLLGCSLFCLGFGAPIVYTAWDGVRTQQQSHETMLRVIEQGPNREAAIERLRQITTECVQAIAKCRDRGGLEGKAAAVALQHLRSEVCR